VTFHEKYQQVKTWHGRALVMEIYHLAMTAREKKWPIANTASYFKCSVGLVSENLKLAEAIHRNPAIMQIESRIKALKQL
jgi:hypothetical protein